MRDIPIVGLPTATVSYADPEVAYAARLIAVLSEMRGTLDDEATKRVLRFALERCGISGVGIVTSPMPTYATPEPPKAELPDLIYKRHECPLQWCDTPDVCRPARECRHRRPL